MALAPLAPCRSAGMLQVSEASCSTRCLLASQGLHPCRRRSLASLCPRAEFSRDQQRPVVAPQQWSRGGYDYTPPPPASSAGGPPRLPPEDPSGGGQGSGGGGGGLSNITKAFIAGAFIMGAWPEGGGGVGQPVTDELCSRAPGGG